MIDGSKLRELRVQAALTQFELAILARVQTTTISKLENDAAPGYRNLETAISLARALGVLVEDILRKPVEA